MKRCLGAIAALTLCAAAAPQHPSLPRGFAYLSDIAPTIVQDVRYATPHNLVGRPLPGYQAPACILTLDAARALASAEKELLAAGLTLRVYDCYQPRRAAQALVAWSKVPSDRRLEAEYYPRVEKSRLIANGYLSVQPPSERGSAVALTVQRMQVLAPRPWIPGRHSCIAPFAQRYHDGSIDMGTTFDCMDPLSRATSPVGAIAETHRAMLDELMTRYGFKRAGRLWWSYVLAREPFPKTSFDFPITAK